jgi:hypothetical protein
MTKLVSFSFCQNQRFAGCPTQLQVVRLRVWFTPREVSQYGNIFLWAAEPWIL